MWNVILGRLNLTYAAVQFEYMEMCDVLLYFFEWQQI